MMMQSTSSAYGRAALCVALGLLAVVAGCSGQVDGPAVAGTWIPVKVPSEHWGSSFDPQAASITFEDGGDWSASDGCKRLDGEYSIEGDRFSSPMSSNSVAVGCVGGEVPYDRLLAKARRVVRTDTHLRFFDRTDHLIIELRPE